MDVKGIGSEISHCSATPITLALALGLCNAIEDFWAVSCHAGGISY
jgi:hypothetical protein